MMGGQQRLTPSAPLPLTHYGRIKPIGNLGQALERRFDRLAQDLRSETGRERVDRLHDLDLGNVLGRHDMVGMHHVKLAAEAIDPAADRARLSERKGAQQIVLARVEKYEVDETGRIGTAYLIR